MKNGEMAVKRKAKRPGQQKRETDCAVPGREQAEGQATQQAEKQMQQAGKQRLGQQGSESVRAEYRTTAAWRASPARTAERRFIRRGPAPTIEIIARIVSTVFMWMKSPGTGRLPVTGKWSRLRSFPERTGTGAFFTAACVAEN